MSDDQTTVGDYLHEDREGILERVDFGRMVKDISKASVVALMSYVTGYFVAVRRSVGGVVGDIYSAGGNVKSTLLSFPTRIQEEAVSVSVEGLESFDVFAGPVGTLVVLAGFLLVLAILYVFFGGDS